MYIIEITLNVHYSLYGKACRSLWRPLRQASFPYLHAIIPIVLVLNVKPETPDLQLKLTSMLRLYIAAEVVLRESIPLKNGQRASRRHKFSRVAYRGERQNDVKYQS